MFRVLTRSLVEKGTPWSGPSVVPRFPRARSAARASRMACSAGRVTKAFKVGFRRSMRASTAFITSTGEIFFRRMAAAISEAGIQHSPSEAMSSSFVESGSGVPKARVQSVAKRVAEQTRSEHGQADGDAREEHEPRRLLCILRGGDREHASPRGIGLGYAQAEEGQGRLDEDGAA